MFGRGHERRKIESSLVAIKPPFSQATVCRTRMLRSRICSPGARSQRQPSIGSGCCPKQTITIIIEEQLFWEVERHLLQPAAGPGRLVGRLPPDQPLRAHGCRSPVLRLQRPQDGGHQVRREQHSLDQLVRQRLVSRHALLGDCLQRGAVRAQPRGQVCEHVVCGSWPPAAGSAPTGRHVRRRAVGGR